jgi:hypothetical protein
MKHGPNRLTALGVERAVNWSGGDRSQNRRTMMLKLGRFGWLGLGKGWRGHSVNLLTGVALG